MGLDTDAVERLIDSVEYAPCDYCWLHSASVCLKSNISTSGIKKIVLCLVIRDCWSTSTCGVLTLLLVLRQSQNLWLFV